MFRGCTSLKSIKCLATDISASRCTSDWVNGVAGSGTFTKAESMSSWTTGVNGIPSGWSVEDYGGHGENLRIWVDDFNWSNDYTLLDIIDDPDGTIEGGNRYEYDGTIELDGETYHAWFGGYGGNVTYVLTTINDFDELYGESMEDNILNTFDSFIGFLDEDEETIYEPSNVQQLLKVYGDYIWVDDFWFEYNLIDIIDDPDAVDSPSNSYDYTGNMFDLDGDEYYLWENTETGGYTYERYYLLTDTIDYDTLYAESLEGGYATNPNTIIGFLSEDEEITYEGSGGELIIKVLDLDE
jgi:hypothetical protein